MSSSFECFLLVVVLTTATWANICLAQAPNDAPATEAEEKDAVQIEGTLLRPESSPEHATLLTAWADYHAALGAVSDDMRASIRELFEAAAAKGDLDEAEKWQTVADKFDSAGVLPRQPELKSAAAVSDSQIKKAEKELLAAYNDTIKSLTIEKKIHEAKAVRDERDEILQARTGVSAKELTAAESIKPKRGGALKPAQPDQWEDITRDMQGGIRRGAVIVIPPNGERVVSSKPFTPPLEIEYVCATARNNIRLGFACNELIFNWEVNRNDLRIEGGPVSGHHLPNAGAVPFGQMVTIRQIVLPNEMTLFVDGQKRAYWVGDFSRVRELIEVFGGDSELQVKSVRVRKPLESRQAPRSP